MQTDLTLSMGGLPPMSARGCIQEIKPISQGEFRRTINGDLIFLGHSNHKYYSKIECHDKTVLATEGLQIGTHVSVGCIQKLCQKVNPDDKAADRVIHLERSYVPDSVYIVDEQNHPYTNFKFTQDHRSLILSPYAAPLFVFYAPVLEMRVVSFQLTTDEWNMKTGWKLELEEI